MINSISNMSQTASFEMQQSTANQQLTTEQTQLIEDTLADLDPDSMTEAQAQTVVETLETAGIAPGAGLEETMSSLGFDAKSIGSMAGVEGRDPGKRPPPPQGTSSDIAQLNVSDETISELDSLITSYYEEENTEETQENLLNSIQEILQAGASEDGLLNITA